MVDPQRNWLLCGSNSGFFTLWDLRFFVPVKTWRHPVKSRIHKIVPHRSMDSQPWVFVTAGMSNEVTVWDVQSSQCKEIFRVSSRDDPEPPLLLKSNAETSLSDYGMEELQRPIVAGLNPNDAGIRTLLNPPGSSYLLTAGDDKKIRYWDLRNIVNSYTISSPSKEQKSRHATHPFDWITVNQEFPNTENAENPSSSSKLRGPASPSVSHRESILDVKMLELPRKMLVSSSRDGVIKVWK